MKDENKSLLITKDDGTELLCEIIFTYFDEETKKNYVVFKTPNDEFSAAYFTESSPTSGNLDPVKDDDEWEMLEDLLNDYYESDDDEE